MKLAELYTELTVRGTGRVQSQLSKTKSSAISTSKAFGGAALAAGTFAVAIGIKSIRAAASFDAAMTKSTSIMVGLSKTMRDEMEKTAKQMSSRGIFAADQLAESYFFLASAGLNAEQSMAALKPVQDFATAGAFDLAMATDLLTDAQSALGLSVQDTGQNMINMTGLSDILVKANTLANASVLQFSEALTSEAGSAMKNFNIDTAEGVAVLAAYADQGIKASHAGRSYSRALRLLQKATRENGEEFQRLGISVFDADGEMNSMASIAGDMERAFAGMSTEAKGAALEQLGFQARTQQVILPLIGASEKIREYRNQLEMAGGTTKTVAENQLQSFSNQLKILSNSLNTVFIDIGSEMLPTLVTMTKVLQTGVDGIREWAPALEQMWTIFKKLSPIVNAVADGLSKIVDLSGHQQKLKADRELLAQFDARNRAAIKRKKDFLKAGGTEDGFYKAETARTSAPNKVVLTKEDSAATGARAMAGGGGAAATGGFVGLAEASRGLQEKLGNKDPALDESKKQTKLQTDMVKQNSQMIGQWEIYGEPTIVGVT